MDHLGLRKMTARAQLIEARAAAFAAQKGNAGEALRDVFLCGVHMVPGIPVSFYYPFGEEMDVLPLAKELERRGHPLCLPCIVSGEGELVFRSYRFGDKLRASKYGIFEPLASAQPIEPTVLLMPMVGFDNTGTRVGLGGGFYDRSLKKIRQESLGFAIGVAFAAQEAKDLPFADYDQKMDLIVTEREVIDPSSSRGTLCSLLK